MGRRRVGCQILCTGDELIVYARGSNKAYRFDKTESNIEIFTARSWSEGSDGYLTAGIWSQSQHRAITTRAHRLIMGPPPFEGAESDHIDRDITNNHLSNLRWVTKEVNLRNGNLRTDNSSGFKGVQWDARNRKWRADYQVNGHKTYIGEFTDKIEAALAYDAIVEQYGMSTNKSLGLL